MLRGLPEAKGSSGARAAGRLRVPRPSGLSDASLAVASALLVGLFLLPLRWAALRGDDTWVSEYRGEVRLSGDGLLHHVWDAAVSYYESGRPNFLSPLQGLSTAWAIGNHPMLYHLAMIALAMVVAALLYLLARQLGLGRGTAMLVTVVMAGGLQARSYHDALLGYWGTVEIVLILTLGSVLAFHRALITGRRGLWWLSLALFLPVPPFYEAAYTVVAVHVGVALLERRGRAALRACLPFVLYSAFWILLSMYARATSEVVVPGYEVGNNPWAALRTYLTQLIAPIPGSNVLFRADYGSFNALGTRPTRPELIGGLWRGLVAVAAVALVAWRLAWADGGRRLPAPGVLTRLAVVGAAFWVSPIVALAAAPKYQSEIVPGKGHLPTFLQSVGWALVAAAVVLALLRAASVRSRAMVAGVGAALALTLGLATGVTAFNNMRVVGLEVPVLKTRNLLESAAANGLLDGLPRGATLLFSNADLHWKTGYFGQFPMALEELLLDRSDQLFDARLVPPFDFSCRRGAGVPPPECATMDRTAAWVRIRARPGGGVAFLATLDKRGRNPDLWLTRHLRVYVDDEGSSPPPPLVGQTQTGSPWSSGAVRWRERPARGGGAIYEADLPSLRALSLEDPRAKLTFDDLGTGDDLVRQFGSEFLLP